MRTCTLESLAWATEEASKPSAATASRRIVGAVEVVLFGAGGVLCALAAPCPVQSTLCLCECVSTEQDLQLRQVYSTEY
jgi:hypothetical protein